MKQTKKVKSKAAKKPDVWVELDASDSQFSQHFVLHTKTSNRVLLLTQNDLELLSNALKMSRAQTIGVNITE